ncbi:MAG TPA: MarR family winged helix-turn-helix transcriptional regulator [Solirubrobacteraceae bacterium]|nr:MarR family winged helix-turn-helix transcriptional regulator [Solirubrobacteraceae bacterium]
MPLSPPAAPTLDLDTAARLRASIGRLSRRLRPTAAGAAAGLTPTRISVLFTIARRGPIRLSDLAEEEGLNPTMLSRVIAGFADAGLVTRVCDPQDRRAALVEATAAGRKLCERMRGERTDVLEVALAALGEDDRRAVEQALPVLEQLAHGLKGRRG